jgi:TorA maturation chaperone TorD
MSAGETAPASPDLAPEDAARAECYAVIGRLFYDAPDSLLLAELCRADAQAEDSAGALSLAWRALHEACRTAFPAVVRQEFDSLFVGVGKSLVTPYTSHYVMGIAPDRHLVRLRERLATMGLARRDAAFELEDHVSGICDVMRLMITYGRPVHEQSLFFNEFTYGGTAAFCEAVERASPAAFYRRVARFAREFLELERQAFDMHDGADQFANRNTS